MPICFGAQFSWRPFPPSAHLPQMPACSKAHRSQSAHLPKNAHFLKCPFVSVSTCPFVPNTHLPKVLICPNSPMLIRSGAHFSRWSLPPNAHLAPISTCSNVHRSQSAHLPHKCSFALVLIFPGAHFPQCPFAPECPLAPMSIRPKVPICSTVPVCPGAHLSWCLFTRSAQHFPPMPTCPNVHRSQMPIFSKVPISPNVHLS